MSFVKIVLIIVAVLILIRFVVGLVSGIHAMKYDKEQGKKALGYAFAYLFCGVFVLLVAFFQSEGVL